ncbi:PIG-L deacetylase family protein [Ramlibacter sp.]|uniref:PIG-L deacetylase family protein n=1 Tax=Ramlibacter sp. TaxID=1917967 RepID=UPI002FCAC5F6
MLPLLLPRDAAAPLRLLFLGAHCDDIEIGCGGTVLRLVAAHPDVEVTWVVFSATDVREQEARASAARFLAGVRRPAQVLVQRFRDGHLPYQGTGLKQCFEQLRKDIDPHLIFTHFREDRHQDHRAISDLTWNTWRSHLVLEYEVPKYDGDLGHPNFFVPLSQSACERKARIICEAFRSEAGKGWLSEDTFLGLARLRGIECAAPDRHAEAFHCRKLVLGA